MASEVAYVLRRVWPRSDIGLTLADRIWIAVLGYGLSRLFFGVPRGDSRKGRFTK
jgi:hypothetical protein